MIEKLIEEIGMVDCCDYIHGEHDITERLTQAYSLGQQELLAKIEGELPREQGIQEQWELGGEDSVAVASGFNSCLNQVKDILKTQSPEFRKGK